MTDPGKLSFYKPASPLERGRLVQGKLQVSSPLDYSEATPTATTEVWSSELPAVQVVRHTSPRELPLPTGGRFSSNFVEFHTPAAAVLREETSPAPPVHSHDTERGEGEGGRCGVERGGVQGVGTSVSDDSRHHTPQETDSPTYSKLATLSSIPKASSSHGQKKKPKGRVVPSRYMLSSSKAPPTSTTPSGHKTLSGKSSTTSSLTKTQTKKSTKSAQKPSVKDDSFKMPSLPAKSRVHPPPSLSSSLPQHPFTPSAITSSTPKVSSSGPQMAARHQSSFIDLPHNPTTKNTTASKPRTKTTGNTQSHDLELELLNSRLLQATYLDIKSAKSLREQEEAAKAQLHKVWEEVERRRRECETLRQELETAQRTTALSSVLDAQVKELSPIASTLPLLQQQHTTLALALDGTRHELATSGVLPVTEQQLEAELFKSEQLLNEIVSLIQNKVPTVTSLADSTEAAVNTLDKEFQEIEKCWSELTKAVKLQVHETSLAFENRQRQRSLSPLPSQNFLTTTHTE